MSTSESIRNRVRRFAVLRVAQRMLGDVETTTSHLEPAVEEGRILLDRMRELDSEGAATEQDLEEIDALLVGFAERFHESLAQTPVRELCGALRRAGDADPSSVRALGSVLLEGDLDNDGTLRLVEAAVTALACEGERDDRRIVRTPLVALPELARVGFDLASPDEVKESIRIFTRAIERLEEDDPGASRDRMRSYKERIGAKLLHPEILAAAVSYNVAMGNRFAELVSRGRERDEFTETLFGRETAGGAGRAGSLASRAAANALRSRLLWSSALTFTVALGSLVLATSLWPGPPERHAAHALVAELQPYVASGYVSKNDDRTRFVGTVSADWEALDLDHREQVVTRVASRLGREGLRELVLVDARQSLQARHDGTTLLWVKPPDTAP